MMDNDPRHVEAAHQAAIYKTGKKLEIKLERLEFFALVISEADCVPLWIRVMAREALR